jgi:uncharacterized membrane protein
MYIPRGLLLVVIVIFIFSPTMQEWITHNQTAWYRPFLAWLGVIYLAYLGQKKQAGNNDV